MQNFLNKFLKTLAGTNKCVYNMFCLAVRDCAFGFWNNKHVSIWKFLRFFDKKVKISLTIENWCVIICKHVGRTNAGVAQW